MPRKNLVRSNFFPYHINARVNNREAFHCEAQEAWRIFCSHLNELDILYGVRIHAFVMMPNHFHLLVTTPYENIDVVMHRFMLSVTKAMNLQTGRSGKVFGARYHWSLVNSLQYLDHVLKYVYRNPVKGGLVSRPEEYAFSSIGYILGKDRPRFMVSPVLGQKMCVPELDYESFLYQLNQPFRSELEDSIRRGLRKSQFIPALPKRKVDPS